MTLQKLHFNDFWKPVGLRDTWNMAKAYGYGSPSKIISVVLIIFIVIVFSLSFAVTLLDDRSTSTALVALLLSIGLPLLIGGIVALAVFRTARNAVRLKRFAAQNKFDFAVRRDLTDLPGLVFSIGRDRQFQAVVSGAFRGLPFAFGNFYCTVGSGKHSRRRSFGVVEVKLSRRLPHILLDARANNSLGFSNLPTFRHNQRLKLEGNFNDYFTLYVPDGYERDALYLITPELMALLIDFGAQFDIEIVDDCLYIYSNAAFPPEQKTLEHIFRLIEILGSEVKENTGRYADANVGDRTANIVAQPGRRLKRVGPWVTIIIIVIYIATTIWLQNRN